MVKTLFFLQLAATLFMTGIIWVVQVVHYPLFAQVGPATWRAYHAGHNTLISLIVVPAMLVELATAVALVLGRPAFVSRPVALLGLTLVVLVWGATFFLSVPQHGALSAGFDGQAHRLLVGTNWVRTAAWTGRAVLLLWLLWQGLPPDYFVLTAK